MADDGVKKEKYKFKPIVATAKKVGTMDGNDVLEINVPIEEDSDALVGAVKRKRGNDEGKGDLDMDETQVEAMLNKKLMEMDIQKTIRDVSSVSLKTKEKVSAIETKLDSVDEILQKIKEQQEESCTGVGCIKGDIENIKKQTSGSTDKLSDIYKKIENIDNRTETINKKTETALCSGPKGCNGEIPVGSSYCPNCRKEIDSWEDMPDWVPYSKRK